MSLPLNDDYPEGSGVRNPRLFLRCFQTEDRSILKFVPVYSGVLIALPYLVSARNYPLLPGPRSR